ncbi:cupin domain-containing protein [Roseovarius sp. S1116L3]|uniref:cupin domain-containing protein n=1 Tax=Roseovarius roseus TaxID=3342636 RepID=UPI00372C9D46
MTQSAIITRFNEHGPEGTGMTEWDPIDPASLVSGEPVQHGHVYYEEEDSGYLSGVWDCTAQTEKMGPYGVDEFMLILEGTLVMAMPDGTEVTIAPGDAFVIPKGFECQWKQPGYLRKFFVILDGPVPEEAQNRSLKRITVPELEHGEALSEGVLVSEQVHFLNAAGTLKVGISNWSETRIPSMPSLCNQLVHVLSGCLTLSGEGGEQHVLEKGQTAHIRAGGTMAWHSSSSTRLLFCKHVSF